MAQKAPKPPRHRPLGSIDFMPILLEMDYADHRAAAIVAGSFLENSLAMAILSRFRELTDKEQKDLFDRDGAVLGTFAAKIDIGYALNLYGSSVVSDLSAIKHIRNQFAHHLEVRDFDHPEVAPKCDGLVGPRYLASTSGKPELSDRRERYLQTVSHLAARFDLESHGTHRPREPIFLGY